MNKLGRLYQELKRKYGKPKEQWSLWCKRKKTKKEREEVIIEVILTQRANWQNVELAIKNLKKEKVDSLKKILEIGSKKLERLIKPSGFYKVKARYLLGLANFILKNYGGVSGMMSSDWKELRGELLKLKGIGQESADSILLYALDKPVFVIDEYTRRLVKERNFTENFSYSFLQKLFEENLRRDFKLYQDFHALIVIDGKSKRVKKK